MGINSEAIWIEYQAATGNRYPLEFYQATCTVKELIYQPSVTWKACAKGCSNFNKAGGCPPRSPKLEEITQKEDTVWVIIARFWSEYKHPKIASSTNSAIHWKFQDAILSSVMYNLGQCLRKTYGGIILGTGYCRGCPGKKCAFKLGYEVCRNPERRTYSMEATGINVVETVKELFGVELYWYRKGFTDVPYMLKAITFIPPSTFNKKLDNQFLLDNLLSMKSLNYAEK